MKRLFIRLVGVVSLVALMGAGCTKGVPLETQKASQQLTLNVWGVVDDIDVYQDTFTQYRALHPNVSFNFRRLRLEEYEDKLLNGFADDRGPDIFLVHNTWVGKYLSKTTPMPLSTKVAYAVVAGTLKKETTWELRTEPSITLREVKEQFADAILGDAIRVVSVPVVGGADPNATTRQERLVAAPIWLDTMALYYNKDLLNAAGIPTPAEHWEEFQEQVKKLTKRDADGKLLQSGAAIGTAKNVERSTDLLAALMMQNGAQMADAAGNPRFDQVPEGTVTERAVPPSYQAAEFYADFANPAKETFTWDASQPNSLEAFIAGKTAFFFGYSYHVDQIKARAPKINLGVTKLPQIEGNPARNIANYWMWVVSKKSANQDTAWNFLNFVMKADTSKALLLKMKRPAARKSLLPDQFSEEVVGVFASQVLTAQSWYRGASPQVVDSAFAVLIEAGLSGGQRLGEAMQFAANQIRQTMRGSADE